MSSQDSNQAPGAEELRRLYRQAGFDEVPSAAVDASALRMAQRVSSGMTARRWLPRALAAAVVVSLSVVLGVRFIGPSRTPDAAALDAAASARRAAAEQPRLEFSTAADTASKDEARGGAELAPQAEGAATALANSVQAPCTQTASAPLWLACIGALVEAGALERAAEELRAFEQRYPEHPLPNELQSLRRAPR